VRLAALLVLTMSWRPDPASVPSGDPVHRTRSLRRSALPALRGGERAITGFPTIPSASSTTSAHHGHRRRPIRSSRRAARFAVRAEVPLLAAGSLERAGSTGTTAIVHWDGSYWFDKATAPAGGLRNFAIGGQPPDPSRRPTLMRPSIPTWRR